MKILYGVQGTGNGHITKAMEMVPLLKEYADVDVLVSGKNYELTLPFEVKYDLKGFTFIMNKSGGIDYISSFKNMELSQVLSDIRNLPVTDYDLVVTDFEPISAWSAKRKKVPVVGFGHQASFAYRETPMPKSAFDPGKWVLKNFVPALANIGVHFAPYHPNIYTPIIRQKIRDLKPKCKNYVVVYLPAIHEDLIAEVLQYIPKYHFCVFSKYAKKNQSYKNTEIFPLSEEGFTEKIKDAMGVITNAGFETPAEALFLGKKLMVIPVKGQFEQQCNALALMKMGIPVLKNFGMEQLEAIKNWIDAPRPDIPIVPADVNEIRKKIFKEYEGLASRSGLIGSKGKKIKAAGASTGGL
ncbi:MAG: glycosyl transferase [Bacteroidia bacterium]|nr:glycosyl transferase [Bacteroidia bacterium]